MMPLINRNLFFNFQCSRKITTNPFRTLYKDSICDNYATLRSAGQHVLSYSYFGSTNQSRVVSHYLDQISARAQEVSQFYPQWIMRIYYDLNDQDIQGHEKLCSIWCMNEHVDLCNVKHLPILGDLKELQPIGKKTGLSIEPKGNSPFKAVHLRNYFISKSGWSSF